MDIMNINYSAQKIRKTEPTGKTLYTILLHELVVGPLTVFKPVKMVLCSSRDNVPFSRTEPMANNGEGAGPRNSRHPFTAVD